MSAGDPIRLGAAATASALIPESGSDISTDDYGIDVGTITFFCPDQSVARASAPARGEKYGSGTGKLAQFAGMYADTSRIIGAEGKAARVITTYKKMVDGWNSLPVVTSDNISTQAVARVEYRFASGTTAYTNDTQGVDVVVPQPVLTYRLARETRPDGLLGTFKSRGDLVSAPATGPFSFSSRNIFSSISNATVRVTYLPNPNGWLCIRNDCVPICGGRFYQIEQVWKMFYYLVPTTNQFTFPPE